MLYTVVKPNSYQDSINLMLLTNRINALDGVVQSQIMMGTDANKDIYEAFDAVSTEGTLLPYLDYATPSFADTAGATLQEVIGGQSDPSAAAEALQEDYGAFTEES